MLDRCVDADTLFNAIRVQPIPKLHRLEVLEFGFLLGADHNAQVGLNDNLGQIEENENVEFGLRQLVNNDLLHAFTVFDRLVAVKDVWIFEISHLNFEFEPAWIRVEWSETDACDFQAAFSLQEEIEAHRVNRVWCNNLRVWRIEIALQKVLKVLQVADLARNSESIAIRRSPLVEYLNGLVAMIHSLIEY